MYSTYNEAFENTYPDPSSGASLAAVVLVIRGFTHFIELVVKKVPQKIPTGEAHHPKVGVLAPFVVSLEKVS